MDVTTSVLYCIEGNISCGKSTVIDNLRLLGYKVFEEPLEVWQKEYVHNGENILNLFYTNMKEWGFKFEMVSMMTRYKQLQSALKSLQSGESIVVFIERSLLTDRYIFALNLYHNGVFDELEWKIYCDWHDLFMDMVRQLTSDKKITTEYIYIQTPPEECYARKIGRARAEENDVAPKYFHELHEKHEEWLSTGWLVNSVGSGVLNGANTWDGAGDSVESNVNAANITRASVAINHNYARVHIIHGYETRERVLEQIVNILGPNQLIKKFISLVEK